jgi:hypothetical protein
MGMTLFPVVLESSVAYVMFIPCVDVHIFPNKKPSALTLLSLYL